jgi:predicted O-methyltransferase YrrM
MSLRHFVRYTAPGRLMLIPFRLGWALTFALRQMGVMVCWAFRSKEYYNHTYELTGLNTTYLASYIAVISGHDVATIEGYFKELETDEALRATLRQCTRESPDRHNSDVEPRYGRRYGWYALVRATKPRVVVETGVDRGLGTVVLAAAVKRNQDEGFPGLVYATDIVPTCGHLLTEPYKACCRILLGDSVETLKQFREPVDIFIHDSDHRPEYEWAEFLAIEPRLHPGSIVMSDNSQQTSKMFEFARRIGKSFLYFQDQPKDHWWPGDGIGAAFVPGIKTFFPSREESAAARPGGP